MSRLQLTDLPLSIQNHELAGLQMDIEGEYWAHDHFRLDLLRGWHEFQPNQSARRVFIRSFTRAVNARAYTVKPDLINNADIGTALDRYIKYVTPLYKQAMALVPTPDSNSIRRRHAYNSRRATVCYFFDPAKHTISDRPSSAFRKPHEGLPIAFGYPTPSFTALPARCAGHEWG